MRIIQVWPEILPGRQARVVQVLGTCTALARLCEVVEVHVAGLTDDPARMLERFGFHLPPNLIFRRHRRHLGPISSSRLFLGGLRRALQDAVEGETVVLTRHYQVAAAAPRFGHPVILEAHEIMADKPGVSARVRRIEIEAYEHAAGVAFLSRGLQEAVRRRFGLRSPAVVTPSGAAIADGEPAAVEEAPSGTYAYAGSFRYPWKGTRTLLEAAAILHRRSPAEERPVLHVYGDFSGAPAEDRRLIEDLSSGGLLVAHGHREHGALMRELRRHPVSVLPNSATSANSRTYSSPLKLTEAMALGMGIVATDLPAIREMVDETCALLVPAGDPEHLARGIDRLLRDPDLRRRLGTAALARARRFSFDARARRLVDLAGSLLSRHA